ncbi:MAG: 3-deoxy-manno-octulosonate cytidylyltransferase [Candidatus Neomarinimicrobiota bacterium]
MKAAGIIPARYQSTRLPGKVLLPLNGFPMLYHVYQRAQRCRELRRVIVATDSPEISAVCDQYGMNVVMTSPEHTSGTDRVAEVAASIEDELIVNIQADEPLLKPPVVDWLVVHMCDHPELPMGTAGSTLFNNGELEDPGVVKVVARDGLAVAFYRKLPAQPEPGTLLRHVGLYAYRKDFLERFTSQAPGKLEQEQRLEQLRAEVLGASIGIVAAGFHSIGVDTEKDYQLLLKNWHHYNGPEYERVEAAG